MNEGHEAIPSPRAKLTTKDNMITAQPTCTLDTEHLQAEAD